MSLISLNTLFVWSSKPTFVCEDSKQSSSSWYFSYKFI